MRRTIALLVPLALLLATASLAAVTVAQQTHGDETPLVVSYGNASDYLTIPDGEVSASDHHAVGLDVGTAVGIDGRTLQASYRMEAFSERFTSATDDANRTAAFEAAITALEGRTDALHDRNEGVIASYANGSISAGTALRERAAIAAEARTLQGSVAELRTAGQRSLAYDLRNDHDLRLGSVSGRLQILIGPVSERTAQFAASGSTPRSVYAEASTDGYVFATVDGTTYVREVYLAAEYDPTAANQFADGGSAGVEGALQRAGDLYPSTSTEGVTGFGTTHIYVYNAVSPVGQLSVYLDGGTSNAFRESQRVNASALPVGDTQSATNGSVTLRVNRTFPTGPMELTLVDSSSGAPIDGTVAIDDHVVGTTGADGSRWAVEPRGGGEVRATTPTANVTLDLSND